MTVSGNPLVDPFFEASNRGGESPDGISCASSQKASRGRPLGSKTKSIRAARSVEAGLREHAPDVPITFRRLAVTPEQVEELSLPTRPAKKSDPEAKKFGAEAVELDAIPPDKLVEIVADAIERHVDSDAWSKARAAEESEQDLLFRIATAVEQA